MRIKLRIGLLVLLLTGGAGRSMALGYVLDDFESYLFGTNLSALSVQGWGASAGVIVTSNVFDNTSQMAAFPPSTVASNTVNVSGGGGKLWTECRLDEAVRTVDPQDLPAVNSNMMVMVGMTTGGYAVVYNPASNGWDVCTNDAMGGDLVGLASGTWARVTLCQDFATYKVALFLNGRLLRQQVPFITNRTSYAGFNVTHGVGGDGYLDDVFVSNAIPPALSGLPLSATSDLDGDSVPDAWEIQSYGTLSSWGPVISNNITLSIPGLTLNNLTVTNGATLTNMVSMTVTGTMTVASASTNLVSGGTTVYSNLVISAGGAVKVVNGTLIANGQAYVGTFILTQNNAITMDTELTLVGLSLTGVTSFTVSSGATATVSGFTNLAVSGAVQVGTNGTLVVSNAVMSMGSVIVQTNANMILNNGTATVSTLTLHSGGMVQVVNGTVVANGETYSGTFILDSGWNGVLRTSSLNYANDFEFYATNMPLNKCGGQGWGASSSDSIVQGSVTNTSPKAAKVASYSMLSNVVVSSTGLKVWTDLYLDDTTTRNPEMIPPATNTGRAVMLYVNTNDVVTLWNSNVWDQCAQDVAGNLVPTKSSGQWVRISLFEDFAAKKVALFIDGRLVRQMVPFCDQTLSSYQGLSVSAGDGSAYLDDVKIWTNIPTGLTNEPNSDLDNDGLPDALEIQLHGDTAVYPRGSVFKIR